MVRADCYFSPLLVHRTYEGLTVNHAPSHYSLLSLLRNDCLREKNSGSFSSVFCAFHDELGSHHFPQMSVVVAIVVMIVQVALKNVRCAFIKFHSIGHGFVCVVLWCVVMWCVVLFCFVFVNHIMWSYIISHYFNSLRPCRRVVRGVCSSSLRYYCITSDIYVFAVGDDHEVQLTHLRYNAINRCHQHLRYCLYFYLRYSNLHHQVTTAVTTANTTSITVTANTNTPIINTLNKLKHHKALCTAV